MNPWMVLAKLVLVPASMVAMLFAIIAITSLLDWWFDVDRLREEVVRLEAENEIRKRKIGG